MAPGFPFMTGCSTVTLLVAGQTLPAFFEQFKNGSGE
jgi:hypothetical protein